MTAPNETLIFAEGLLYGVMIFYCFTSIIISILINIKGYYYFSLFLLSGVIYNFVKSEHIRLGFNFLDNRSFEILEHYLMLVYLLTLLLFIWYYLNNRYNIPKFTEWTLRMVLLTIIGLFVYNIVSNFFYSYYPEQLLNFLNGWIFQTVNIILGILLIAQYPKLRDKQMTIFTILYFGIFSILFFNPDTNISTLFSKKVSEYFLYCGGLVIGILLMIITILRAFYIRSNSTKIAKEIRDTHLAYAYALIQGRQNERRRFAEELHDHIGISLTTLKINSTAFFDDVIERNIFNKKIDILCKKVRNESHELLPPTLTKFGLQKALLYYREQKNRDSFVMQLKWNLHNEKLSSTTEYVIYFIVTKTLDYVCTQKVEGIIQCTLIQFPTSKFIKLKINYTGHAFDKNQSMISSTKSLLKLLNGNFYSSIKNIWDNQVDIEIPYVA